MGDVFVAVAHLIGGDELFVGIGLALSYGEVSDLAREWVKGLRNVGNVLWVGVGGRCRRV